MARDRADLAASGACDWCEEVSASRKLFTRHQGDIRGFCSHQCFESYAETEFKVTLK